MLRRGKVRLVIRKFHMRPIVMLCSQRECSVFFVTNPAVSVQCCFSSPPERDVCLIQVEQGQRIHIVGVIPEGQCSLLTE